MRRVAEEVFKGRAEFRNLLMMPNKLWCFKIVTICSCACTISLPETSILNPATRTEKMKTMVIKLALLPNINVKSLLVKFLSLSNPLKLFSDQFPGQLCWPSGYQ
jgi:hypothetical protein